MTQSETKYTPGPWSVEDDSCAECVKLGKKEFVLDGPPGGAHGQFSREADARLAAAAPDLLEALLGIRHQAQVHVLELDTQQIVGLIQLIFEVADAAITRATEG